MELNCFEQYRTKRRLEFWQRGGRATRHEVNEDLVDESGKRIFLMNRNSGMYVEYRCDGGRVSRVEGIVWDVCLDWKTIDDGVERVEVTGTLVP